MNFVTELPLSKDYNAIFVYVDWLTKYIKFIPCFMGEDLLIDEQVALLFFENVVQYFGISISVFYDRDPRFTSDFWQSLWKLIGSHATAISAHHPQADGYTKRMNHTIGQILHVYLLDKYQEH